MTFDADPLMSSISKNPLTFIEASGDGSNRVRVEFRRLRMPSKWFLFALAIPMLIALGISGYLSYVSITASEIAGCSGGKLFDCAHVIYSKWSKVFGFPVSGLAVLTYVGMITALAVASIERFSASIREFAWTAVTGLAIAAALAGLYFIFLQVFVLEHLCPWCLGAHACGLLIAVSVLFCKARPALGRLSAVSSLAAAGLAVMIGIQVNSEEPPKYEVITLVPQSAVVANTANGDQTFTAAPADLGSDDGFMSAPGAEDDLFAPPVDAIEEDDLFAPPVEDVQETEIQEEVSNLLRSKFNVSLALISQIAIGNSSLHSALLLPVQEPQQTDPKQSGSETKQEESSSTTKQAEEPKAKEPAKKKKKKLRVVEFMGKKINAYQWPIDGKPDAKYAFVEMFDYTCPHCRTTSKAIFKVKEILGDDLAVVVLPVPMNTRCNPAVRADHADHVEACELSELAVAVWRIDASKFSEFHHWMFEGDHAPNYSTAYAKASELVTAEKLNKEQQKGTSAAFVKSHCQMYQMLNAGPVPKLLFPTRAVQGEFTSVEELTRMIQQLPAAPIPASSE